LFVVADGFVQAQKLGKPHVQRHLATLEALRNLVARLRTLGTAASSLALAALTTTNAGLGGLGPGGRARVVNLQGGRFISHDQSTSSTATRCLTVTVIPRISGRSSWTAVSPMCFR